MLSNMLRDVDSSKFGRPIEQYSFGTPDEGYFDILKYITPKKLKSRKPLDVSSVIALLRAGRY